MIQALSTRVLIATAVMFSIAVSARADKPPCGAFQKTPDGKWNVVKAVKIENGKASVTLKPGTSIGPGTTITNVDIYTALQKGCQ